MRQVVHTRTRAPAWRLHAALLACVAALAGCSDGTDTAEDGDDAEAGLDGGAAGGDDAALADAGGAADLGGGDTTADTMGAGDDVAQDAGPRYPEDTGAAGGVWTQINVPGNPSTSFGACWSESSTRVLLAGTGGTIVGYDGLAWSVRNEGSFGTLHGIAAAEGGAIAHAAGVSGALLQSSPTAAFGTGWGPPGGCEQNSDCDDGDPCTSDVCEAGVCSRVPSNAPGCCGSAAFGAGFDGETLAGWVVEDIYANSPSLGGVLWHQASVTAGGETLATTPPNALHFGLTATQCAELSETCPSFDNGQVVGSVARSPAFAVPEAAKVTLSFQLRLDVENGSSWDKLEIRVLPANGGAKTVWTKADLGPGGQPKAAFALQEADLTAYAGQTVELELRFDSVDAGGNSGDGVFIDDLLVTTACAPVGSGPETITNATFFDVWAAADDDAYAVGSGGAIAHWDGKTWSMQTGGAVRDARALGGYGPLAFGVGDAGLLGALGPAGLGQETGPSPLNLTGVHVQPSADGGSVVAMAVGAGGTVLEYDGTTWSSTGISPPVSLSGVTGVAGGWMAIAGNAVYHRNPGSTNWNALGAVSGTLRAIDAVSPTSAMAVGDNGLLATWDGLLWTSSNTLGKGAVRDIDMVSEDAVWVVGDAGLVGHYDGTTWEGVDAGTSKNLTGVWAMDDDHVFAVGLLGTIIQFDGVVWKTMVGPADDVDWHAVWGRSLNEVYAAGTGGVVARYDGASWKIITAPVTATLRSVWGSGPDDVWAVGVGGAIYHSDGSGAWGPVPIQPYEIPQQEPYIVETTLHAVWGSGPDDIWAAGAPDTHGAGVLVHYNGQNWNYTPVLQAESRTVRGIWGWEKNRMLLTGTGSMVYLFDGGSLEALSPPVATTLFDICAFGNDALLVGSAGTVLRYSPAP